MEKRVVLAIGITVALYVVYLTFFVPAAPPPKPRLAAGTAPSTGLVAPGQVAPGQGYPGQTDPDHPVNGGARKPAKDIPAGPDEKLVNGSLELTFTSRGGALKSAAAWACEYHGIGDRSVTGDPGQATGWVDGMPGALSFDLLGVADAPDVTASNLKLSRSQDEVLTEFEAAGLMFTRRVRISNDPAHPYHANVEYTIRNVSATPGVTRTFEVIGPVTPHPTIPTDDGVMTAPTGEDDPELLHAPKVREMLAENPPPEHSSPTGKWAWIASRADFYLGALAPVSELPSNTRVGYRIGTRTVTPGVTEPAAAATFQIPYVVGEIGAETRYDFLFFAGPNQRSLLQDEASPYHVFKGAIVNRKFIIVSLGPIQRLLAWLLKQLASTGMGYGLAVISLTILVRGALFPLSRKTQISMRTHAQKMQRLKPKMDAVKAKHKDPRKQQEATMKLMREEKVSILPGGCLLAFAQMPIWISLYNVLQTTFEMRHASFLWARDLTAGDHLFRLPFAAGWPILGGADGQGWFNLLPLIMMAVWWASASMQPLPADPQQAQQAKMMRWMPLAFGFFLYDTASGLTLYMTMSALWTIGETWLIKKVWLKHLEPVPPTVPAA